MGDSFRGFGDMLVKVAGFIAVMVGVILIAGYFVTSWIDAEFGSGTATPLILIGAGLMLALLIVVVVTFLNNMTHRAAGDDIVAIFDGVSQTLTAREQSQAKLALEGERRRTLGVKDEMDARKTERGVGAFIDKHVFKRESKQEERRRKEQEAQEAIDGEWEWINGYDTGQASGNVEVID